MYAETVCSITLNRDAYPCEIISTYIQYAHNTGTFSVKTRASASQGTAVIVHNAAVDLFPG
jgi:hypothetical protein